MKIKLFFVCFFGTLFLLLPILGFSQFTHKIKADSVRIYNDNCTAELIVENSTSNIKGFLFNKGFGRTEFRKAVIKLSDSSFLIGGDTLTIKPVFNGLLPGSVLFYDGTVINQDNDNFYWDNSNKRLGIGTNAPQFRLDMPAYSTSEPQIRTGSLEFQSYSLNNTWFGDNAYYDGSGFRFRNNGHAGLFYFAGKEGQFRFMEGGVGGTSWPSATGGADNNGNTQLKIHANGTVALGGSMTYVQGNFTNAGMIVKPNAVLIGTTSDDELNKLQVNGYTKASGFRIPSGTASQFLKADGSVDNGGYVLGPASVVSNRLPLFDGTTGKIIKSSLVEIIDYPDAIASVTEIVSTVDQYGNGREISLMGADGLVGGPVFIAAGISSNGNGANAGVYARRGIGTNKNGGSVFLDLGGGTGTGLNGTLDISLNLAGGRKRAKLSLDNLTSLVDRIYTFPDASGQFALVSNLSSYLPLAGGTLTGALNGTSAMFNSSVSAASYQLGGVNALNFSGTAVSLANNSFWQTINLVTNGTTALTLASNQAATFSNSVTASSLIKSGGTSTQFLKADGSVDNNTYATTAALGNYLALSGGTVTGPTVFNTGTQQPLKLTTSSGGPWALELFRNDLSSGSRVFNDNGSRWYFEHRPVFAGNIAIDAANYNSYSPTLTGGGASGTWPISITGNANYASSAGSVAWSNVSGRPTALSQFTNDLPNYGNWQPLENQRLSTSNDVSFGNIYSNGWLRNNNANEGLYNQAVANHFYASNNAYWNIAGSNGSYGGLILRDNHNGPIKGYYYWDGSGAGLLTNQGNWALRLNYGGGYPGGQLYGSWTGTISNAQRADRANGNFYIDDNYGNSIIGNYASTRYQGIYAMGASYKLPDDGTHPGSLYGLAWTHDNVGGQAKSGLGHQMLVMENGVTQTAIGNGIWTRANIVTTNYGSAAQWNDKATHRSEGTNYIDYSRYVYNNGAYSGGGWVEPSDLGVRYANSAGSATHASYLGGHYYDSYIGKFGNSYYQTNTWQQFNGSFGLYWPSPGISAYGGSPHFYPNSSSPYGSFTIVGSRNGYSGLHLNDASGTVVGMYDGAGNGGDYDVNTGWHFYWNRSNNSLGIGGSTTASGYKMYVNGSSYVDGNIVTSSYGSAASWNDKATHRGEGTNFIDYSRYVYNNGAYSGSGWVEPSDLGVRYANSAGYATTAGSVSSVDWSSITNKPAIIDKINTPASYSATPTIKGEATGSTENIGIMGIGSYGSNYNVGVHGDASYAGTTGIGTYGRSYGASSSNYGIYGTAGGGYWNYAGYFDGVVYSSSYFTTSDLSVKKNIVNEESILTKVKQLRPVSFDYEKGSKSLNLPTEKQHGFIAQELQEIFPESVKLIRNPVFEGAKLKGHEEILGINYQSLIPILVKALQEQDGLIEELKKRIETLEKRK